MASPTSFSVSSDAELRTFVDTPSQQHDQPLQGLDSGAADSTDRGGRGVDLSDDDDEEDESDRRKPVPGSRDAAGPPRRIPSLTPQLPQPSQQQQAQQQQQGRGYVSQPRPPLKPAASASQVPNKTRYFILKSINSENIQRAVSEGIWATQVHNEVKLNEAFRNSERVFLIFSVNASGHFQGYARMTTLVGGMRGRPSSWLGTASVGNIFGIEWQRVVDLEFSATAPLGNNPLNENKPVRIARDGQELPNELGASMVALFEETAKRNGCAKPVPPPRPPPQPRPPNQGASQGAGGMPPGLGTRPVAGAMVFNEMGMPMGPLGSFGLGAMNGGGGGYGMPVPGNMMRPGMSMGMGMNGMGMGGMMGLMGRGMPGPMGAHGMMHGGGGGMGQMGPMGSLPMPALNMGMGQTMGQMGQNMGMPQNSMVGMNGGGGGYGSGSAGMLQGSLGGSSGPSGHLGSGMDRVWRDPGLLLPSRRRSPEFDDRGRSRKRRSRSRSRSYSRRRHRSSRRSRSRSRSSSRGRSRAGLAHAGDSNVLDMTYEDYLEQFERMRQQKAATALQVGHPQQQQQQQPQLQEGAMNGNIGGGSGMAQNVAQGGGAGGRPVLMSEQAYIHHCRQLALQNGTPFDVQAVQQFYRQMAAQMSM